MKGQRIDDHSFWGGSAEKGCVFPKGNAKKMFSSSEGCGGLERYEDSDPAIKACQEKQRSKAKSQPMKEYYRH